MKKIYRLLVSLYCLMTATFCFAAEAIPRQEGSACPYGYVTTGNYCVTKQERTSLPRQGACPTQFTASGGYCTSTSDRPTILRSGPSCPTGWIYKGSYCQEQ